MKEFTSAVTEVVEEEAFEAALAEREAKIEALIEQSKEAREVHIAERIEAGDTKAKATKSAPKILTRSEAEAEVPKVESEVAIEFMLDGRVMHAYRPTPGQLTFLLATMGRGQTADGRFASIVNLMFESLRADDKDHFESRMLTRDPKKMVDMDVIEGIFEYLMEEWFATPTQ